VKGNLTSMNRMGKGLCTAEGSTKMLCIVGKHENGKGLVPDPFDIGLAM